MGVHLFRRNLARRGKSIILQNRNLEAPEFGQTDFSLDFANSNTVKALIHTTRGKTLFDGVATDRPITHEFSIEYIEGVTQESWISYGGRRFDILDVENCCEEDQILILRSTETGLDTKEASKS